MVVAACQVRLSLDGVYSLKEKRSIVKSVLARISQEFHVSAAEVDEQDVWQTSVLGFAIVGNDSAHLHAVLEKVVQWLESNRPDLYIVDYQIEMR